VGAMGQWMQVTGWWVQRRQLWGSEAGRRALTGGAAAGACAARLPAPWRTAAGSPHHRAACSTAGNAEPGEEIEHAVDGCRPRRPTRPPPAAGNMRHLCGSTSNTVAAVLHHLWGILARPSHLAYCRKVPIKRTRLESALATAHSSAASAMSSHCTSSCITASASPPAPSPSGRKGRKRCIGPALPWSAGYIVQSVLQCTIGIARGCPKELC
jgi:hypothetical protein